MVDWTKPWSRPIKMGFYQPFVFPKTREDFRFKRQAEPTETKKLSGSSIMICSRASTRKGGLNRNLYVGSRLVRPKAVLDWVTLDIPVGKIRLPICSTAYQI